MAPKKDNDAGAEAGQVLTEAPAPTLDQAIDDLGDRWSGFEFFTVAPDDHFGGRRSRGT
jgi:hypothetical protein